MVKKLLKHEFFALWRLMGPIWGVLLGVSVLGRFVQLFEQDTVAYDIVSGSAIFFYFVSLCACLVCPFVFATTRFYRNFFNGEGYLTLTLPVTTDQHLLTKLFVAVTTEVATLLVAVVSMVLITFGDLTVEIFKAVGYILEKLTVQWGAHFPLYIVEAIIAVIVLFAFETMLFYTCISIGQQSQKNRVLAAVGTYFGIYVIQQILGTIALLVGINIDWEPLAVWVAEHPFATVHMVLCGVIMLAVAISCLFYWISRRLMIHRLNLE